MTEHFHGFPEDGLSLLRELAANNTKEWFHEHRPIYEAGLRRPAIALLEALNHEFAEYAPAYRVSDPARALSRPNRDIRFSKDKRPYRTEISAVLPYKGRPKHAVAGFFFSIAPDRVEVLGGAYMPGTGELAVLRRFLVDNVERVRAVVDQIEASRLVGTLQGEQAKRVPAGFPAHEPASGLARYKQLYFRTAIEPAVALSATLVAELSRRFRVMTPFVELLDEGLGAARPQADV